MKFFIPEIPDYLQDSIEGIAISKSMIVIKFHGHRCLDLELDGDRATMVSCTVKQVALLTKTICQGCGKMIDTDVCGCGASLDSHTNPMHDGHPFVPLGCDCLRGDR